MPKFPDILAAGSIFLSAQLPANTLFKLFDDYKVDVEMLDLACFKMRIGTCISASLSESMCHFLSSTVAVGQEQIVGSWLAHAHAP